MIRVGWLLLLCLVARADHGEESGAGPFALFPGRVQRTVLQFRDVQGRTPKEKFFNDDFVMRQLAKRINAQVYAEETDKEIKASIDPKAAFLTLTFAGILFERSGEDPDKVYVTVVGQTRQTKFPTPLSLRQLERGEEVEVTGQSEKSNWIGAAVGTTTVKFRYDPAKGEIVDVRIKGSLRVTTALTTSEDSVDFTGLTASKGEVREKPTHLLK